MNAKIWQVGLALLSLLGAGAAAAEEIRDFTSLVRGVQTPDGVELRVMAPRFTIVRNGGVPVTLKFWFDVYKPGSALNDATKLFSTTTKAVAFPALPCSLPVAGSADHDLNPKFFGRWGGSRAHAVVRFSIQCQDQNQGSRQADSTFVYSADVGQTAAGPYAGSVWSKAFANTNLAAANSLDLNQDQIGETLMLTMVRDTASGASQRSVLMNFSDGTIVKDQTFPIVQFVDQTQ